MSFKPLRLGYISRPQGRRPLRQVLLELGVQGEDSLDCAGIARWDRKCPELLIASSGVGYALIEQRRHFDRILSRIREILLLACHSRQIALALAMNSALLSVGDVDGESGPWLGDAESCAPGEVTGALVHDGIDNASTTSKAQGLTSRIGRLQYKAVKSRAGGITS